jgi:lipid A 3-O-deacylase
MRVHLYFTTLALTLGWATCHGQEAGAVLSGERVPPHLPFEPSMTLAVHSEDIHRPALGQGFTSGAKEAGFAVVGGFGLRVFGGRHPHDLTLGSLHYGWVFSDVVAKGHWYQGNWELLGELFGGAQYNSRVAYLAGITPGLRYNFITGTRLVPFVHAGVGATLTDIRAPDLGSTFEFNLQAGTGLQCFFRENAAFTVQYRFIHISNAGIRQPNQGLNAHAVFVGVSWFFGGASPRPDTRGQ